MRSTLATFLPLLVLAGCSSDWSVQDADNDGFSLADGDCWDSPEGPPDFPGISGADINPDAAETWYDGLDQDCGGGSDFDQDGDGHDATDGGGDDCWDDPTTIPARFTAIDPGLQPAASDVYPGAAEVWYDGADEDCSTGDDFDQDGDGYASATHADAAGLYGDDCYDAEDDAFTNDGGLDPADVHPDAEDAWYDGTDADCADNDDFDQDGDGFARDDECDDLDPARFPNDGPEVWYDGVDDNCDGNDGDQDGDGYYEADYAFEIPPAYQPGDCWDDVLEGDAWVPLNGLEALTPAVVHPDAADAWYDGLDADCAGGDDFDQDADGHDASLYLDATGVPAGDDCDDVDAAVNPDAAEVWYDGIDEDCAGDDDYDADADGHASGFYDGDDCDDANAAISPAATEVCGNAVDENCSTDDEGATGCTDFFADVDGDGYGSTADSACLCDATGDYTATTAEDCDDADAAVSPAATESCATAADDDCDGVADAIGATGCSDFYEDGDGDGYGGPASQCTCDPMGDYAASAADDCDDAAASVNPGADEECNGDDDDCDGSTDEGLPLYYADADADGYGTGTGDCTAPSGWAAMDGDCDDTRATVTPGAPELCDGLANDCDSASTWTASDEDQLVSLETTDGVWSDVSSSFTAGTATAFTAATSGTYRFCAGTYHTKLVIGSSLSSPTTTVIGVYGAGSTTIDNNATYGSTLAATNGQVSVSGLTITGGRGSGTAGSTYGGAVIGLATTAPTAPSLTLTDCVVSGGAAAYGAGISVFTHAWVSLDGTSVTANTATSNGGGIHVSTTGTLDLTDSTVSGNTTPGNGGGIYISTGGVVDLDSSTVSGNTTTSTGDGGGIYVGGGTVALTDSVVSGNTAGDDAGGLFLDTGSATCTATTTGGIYDNTAADNGGGVYLYSITGGTFTSVGCDFGTGALDNSPNDADVRTSSSHNSYTAYSSAASFVCSGVTHLCTP